jgi:hypothetical protein
MKEFSSHPAIDGHYYEFADPAKWEIKHWGEPMHHDSFELRPVTR